MAGPPFLMWQETTQTYLMHKQQVGQTLLPSLCQV